MFNTITPADVYVAGCFCPKCHAHKMWCKCGPTLEEIIKKKKQDAREFYGLDTYRGGK